MKRKRRLSLKEKYPPSVSCSCDICTSYCIRPGWWSVEEAARAMEAGLFGRMMLEISPEGTFGVLSPAFKGCEGKLALQACWGSGCTFLKNDLCELYDSGFEPMECLYCHHTRSGLGQKCHADLEKDWYTPAGQALVVRWMGNAFRLNGDGLGIASAITLLDERTLMRGE